MPPSLHILPRTPSPQVGTGRTQKNRRPHPLHEGKPRVSYRIMSMQLAAGERDMLYRRGLIEGRVLTLIHNDFKGRLVVQVDGLHIILGRNEGHRILVRMIPKAPTPR
ncbi:MAG: ferrous iron transport protein A [Verrucomicrobia bacterium]|nr:ferrous iron transport protein A [Verrucomicrobiota bacterium]MCH8511635.1 ferrous iron transport protein A [Kiritimatiellia bacterium]